MTVSVLGIDPGSRITGYGLVEIAPNHQLKHIAHGSIPVASKDLALQLKKIYSAIGEIISIYHPQEISVERIFMHENVSSALQLKKIYSAIGEIISIYHPQEISVERIFMHENVSSALKLGQARGVAIVAASQHAPLFEYTARQVKLAVAGYGAASKEQIQLMVTRLLKLDKKPAVDAADALAIAICHAHSRKMNAIQGLRIEGEAE